MEIVGVDGGKPLIAGEIQWEAERQRLEKERNDAVRRAEHLEEQLSAMIDGTHLLTQIITKVSKREIRPQLPMSTLLHDLEHCEGSATTDNEDLLFDKLAKEWKLEDTGIPTLYSACKAITNNLRLTQREADDALDQIVAAKHAAELAEQRLAATSKALCHLWKENSDLKRERKKLVRGVRGFIEKTNCTQKKELDEMYACVAHEQSLRLSFRNSFDDDHSSVSSAQSTVPSCASSDSQATVHFECKTQPTGDILARWMNKQDQKRNIYKITFDSRQELGIKLYPMPLNPKHDEEMSNFSPPRMNLVGLQVDVSKLLRRRPLDAFIVCGFTDFGCCSSSRPVLGSRLVAIDDVSLEHGEWSLKKLAESIRSRKGAVCLSFRNDILTPEQIVHLNENLVAERTMVHDDPNGCKQ